MTSPPPPDAPARRLDWTLIAAVAGFALVAGFLLIEPAIRATLVLEQPNEGWNAIHALHAFSAGLYPARSALFINNYPPLWFWLTGALGRWFGDPILPGRALAFASFFCVALAIFILVRRLGVSRGGAALGALAFSLTLEAHFATYVGLAEPQMLAHALATGGAALALGASSRRAIVGAALLTVLAMLVKPVVIGLPLAVTVWLAMRNRAFAIAWVAAGAGFAVAALAALVAAYGAPLVENLAAPRYFAWERLGTNIALALRVVVPLMTFAIPAAILRRTPDSALAFAALAIGAALVPIIGFGSALGVSINIGFDLVIAASIGFSVAWDRAALAFGEAGGRAWRIAMALALVIVSIVSAPRGDLDFSRVRRERAISASLASLRDRLATLRGPVVCETLSVCLWAGKPSDADLWKLRHERTLAFLDPAPMLAKISAGEYGAVVTLGPIAGSRDDGHLTGIAAALGAGYGPAIRYAGGTSLYLPKRPR